MNSTKQCLVHIHNEEDDPKITDNLQIIEKTNDHRSEVSLRPVGCHNLS